MTWLIILIIFISLLLSIPIGFGIRYYMNSSKMESIKYTRALTQNDPDQESINDPRALTQKDQDPPEPIKDNRALTQKNPKSRKIKISDNITRIGESANKNLVRTKISIPNSHKTGTKPRIDYNTINTNLSKKRIPEKTRNKIYDIKNYYNGVLNEILDKNIHDEYNDILNHIIKINNFDINTREFIDTSFNIIVPAPILPVNDATSIEDIQKNMEYLEKYRLDNVKLMMRISDSIKKIDDDLYQYLSIKKIYLDFFSKNSSLDMRYIDDVDEHIDMTELGLIKLGNQIFKHLRIIYLYIRILNMYQEFFQKLEILKK